MTRHNGQAAPSSETPAAHFGGGLAGLLGDLLNLAELQVQLLGLDAKETSGRMILPLGLIAAAAVIGLCALPLGLIAIGQVLHYQAGWPPALATLAALGIGLVVAGILAVVGYLLLRRCIKPLGRSREELQRNIAWLKGALRRYDHRPRVPIKPAGDPQSHASGRRA